MRRIFLRQHDYKYFPYELDFAEREVGRLPNVIAQERTRNGWWVETCADYNELRRLVYSATFSADGSEQPTLQHLLESSNSGRMSKRRQSTRYSVHGLHEYKGKFNPQVVRGILNSLGITSGQRVLDPFCGSGTSLVECAYGDIESVGFDLNPLAVFISRTKLLALSTPTEELDTDFRQVMAAMANRSGAAAIPSRKKVDIEYLAHWFDEDILIELEKLRGHILRLQFKASQMVLLAIISDLLRDYSRQEPSDLRIRRRKSPMPEVPLLSAFETRASEAIEMIAAAQRITGLLHSRATVSVADNRLLGNHPENIEYPFDAAITSPPYATALPYIDTQRLSLVWLGLADGPALRSLEADLTGSREFVRKEQKEWNESLVSNDHALPKDAHSFCLDLAQRLSPSDGFRRKAVPALLYRYLSSMRSMFAQLSGAMREDAPFALIVGHNRTTLGGAAIDIDTPSLLALVADGTGWRVDETVSLQTYQRYGIHQRNSVNDETLLILRRN